MTHPGKGAERAMGRFVGSWVPGAMAQFTQGADPIRREYYGILDQAKDRLGLGGYLEPVYNDFGQIIFKDTPLPVVNPFLQRKVSEEWAAAEYAWAGGAPPKIPEALGGSQVPLLSTAPASLHRGVPLTPQQRSRYAELLGTEVRNDQGQTMLEALNAKEFDADYNRLPSVPAGDNARLVELNRTARDFHKRTRERLMDEHPDLRQQFESLEAERRAARAGEGSLLPSAPILIPGAQP